MRFWQALVAAALILSAGLGLLALSGHARGLLAPGLRAELRVQDFPLPPDMGVDPARVATFMAAELQDRLEGDVAIRLTLTGDSADKVRDIVLPRLMNGVAVQAMLQDIPELSALLDMGSFRRTLSGEVVSREAADDVALTVPGALQALVDGAVVEPSVTSTGLTALALGAMEAGQSRRVVVWMDDAVAASDLGRSVRLGAAGGQRGRVLIGGAAGWFGADLETLRWARWLVGGVLAAVLLFGLASLAVPLLAARRWRGRPGAPVPR